MYDVLELERIQRKEGGRKTVIKEEKPELVSMIHVNCSHFSFFFSSSSYSILFTHSRNVPILRRDIRIRYERGKKGRDEMDQVEESRIISYQREREREREYGKGERKSIL